MKVQRISDIQGRFSLFSFSKDYYFFYNRFLESDLGKIYLAIPWDNLVKSLDVEESKLGRNCLFSPKGRIGLLFLKHYAGCSDRKLIEQLNSNLDYQFFCDIQLGFQRLTNYKIVSQIRCELSEKLNIESLQKVLYNHWKTHLSNTSHILVDATCYESELRYYDITFTKDYYKRVTMIQKDLIIRWQCYICYQ